jgi:hypothetical protein
LPQSGADAGRGRSGEGRQGHAGKVLDIENALVPIRIKENQTGELDGILAGTFNFVLVQFPYLGGKKSYILIRGSNGWL